MRYARVSQYFLYPVQIRRRRLARLATLGASSASPGPLSPAAGAGVSAPFAEVAQTLGQQTEPQQQREPSLEPIPLNANNDPKFPDDVNKSDVADKTKMPSDGIIVTEKTETLIDEMPDTKMSDLSQSRQFSSFDSMGEDTLLSCGSVHVGGLPQATQVTPEAVNTREDSASRSMSPAQFVEPPPVKPYHSSVSPGCSRRSLSMEVDDISDKTPVDHHQEAMEVIMSDALLSKLFKIISRLILWWDKQSG